MEDLAKHVNELAVALGVLATALTGLALALISVYSKLRAAKREADVLDRRALAAEQAQDRGAAVAYATLASVDQALGALPPDTARLVRARLKATQQELGVQSDVARVLDVVRGVTPPPPGAPVPIAPPAPPAPTG